MSANTTPAFEGWVAHDASSAEGNMKWGPFEPKEFEESDIEFAITHCGVCGSDIHTLRSGWGPSDYPAVVGHELIGHVTRVGSKVSDLKIGDRVGVGAQSDSCQSCKQCNRDNEPHCEKGIVQTYNGKHYNGGKSYGGYAKAWRGPAAFAFKIPDSLPSEIAAPMLCGGVTVYNPLVANGAGPGKRVGVVGVGGLGHFAVLFAKALGADKVVGISRSSSKKADALKLGADEFIATAEEPDWSTKYASSLDIIISTVSGQFPIGDYLNLLDTEGTFVQVGAPEDPLPSFSAAALIFKKLKIGGSLIGGRKSIRDMLDLAAKQKIHSWVEVRPMSEANQVIVDMEDGKARYRYVLAN